MVSAKNAPVNPQTLIAARKLCGYSLEDATAEISTNLARWEEGSSQPTWKQVSKLASVYQLPQNLFFLSKLPDTLFPPKAVDFRTASKKGAKLNNLGFILRRGWENRTIALDLMAELGRTAKEFLLDLSRETALDAEDVLQGAATQIQEILGGLPETLPFKTAEDAFTFWRTRVESIGVLVFERKKVTRGMFSTEEFRGLCLSAEPLPVILINHNDATAGKTFTLLHELVHLARRQGGMCAANRDHAEEAFCDEVAARVLLPGDLLRQYLRMPQKTEAKVWSNTELQSISKHFRVSKHAVLIRLVKLNLAPRKDYWDRWHPLFTEYERQRRERNAKQKEEGKHFGQRSMPNEKLREFGRSFISLALMAYQKKVLPPRDLLSTLDLKADFLEDLKKKVPPPHEVAFME